jgi:hypothetical protein
VNVRRWRARDPGPDMLSVVNDDHVLAGDQKYFAEGAEAVLRRHRVAAWAARAGAEALIFCS